MNPNNRLRIATRIHYGLLRHMGSGIDVGYMLKREDYAREVLYVCEGSGDAELMSLARQFERATIEQEISDTRAAGLDSMHAPLDSMWSRSTSFGTTRAGELEIGAAKRAGKRWSIATWWSGSDSVH